MLKQADLNAVFDDVVGAITGKTSNSSDKDDYRGTNRPISLSQFKSEFWPGYEAAAHQALIDEKLEQVALYILTQGREGIGRLMIFMPPRHGKTGTASRMFPAWMLSRKPDLHILMMSYGARLATRNSRYIRNLIASDEYRARFPGTSIKNDTAAANEWDTTEGGGVIAGGAGTGITGHGGKLAIVDDPVRSRADAESDPYRQKTKDWYTDDLLTRVEEPGGAIVVMQTRWHMDDLSGWLLREDDEHEWVVLSLPALAGADDPLGRQPGAALWPSHYPVEMLQKRQREIGDYSFAALYQQSPVPSQGGLFKREKFKIVDVAPANIGRRAWFWDLALSEKTTADYTVGVLMGITGTREIVILDVRRFQVEWDEVVGKIATAVVTEGPRASIGVEAAFYQTRAVKKLLQRQELHGYSIRGIKPDADKFTRALPFAARVGEDVVYVLRRAWTEALIEELCSFPYGANDDQVDACSGAYLMLDALTPPKTEVRGYFKSVADPERLPY